MSRPQIYCYQCHGRHQATAKNFPGRLVVKEPEEQPDGTWKIMEVTRGLICKVCASKNHLNKMKPQIREAMKLDPKQILTKHHIRAFFADMKNNMAKVMRGDK